MKLRNILTLAVAALALGVPVAVAEPGGPYQPQVQDVAQPDALDRYLRNNTSEEPPDAIARYLRNHTAEGSAVASTGAAGDPAGEVASVAAGGRDWTTGVLGALAGAFLAFLMFVSVSSIRARRRLVLR